MADYLSAPHCSSAGNDGCYFQDPAQHNSDYPSLLTNIPWILAGLLEFLLLVHYNLLWIILSVLGFASLHPGFNSSTGKAFPSTQRPKDRHEPYRRAQSARDKNNQQDERADADNGSGGGDIHRSKRRALGNKRVDAERLFACPCWTFNPIKYTDCLERNRLKSTAFVRQHLLRGHIRQPIHCPVCGETFTARFNCDNHIRRGTCERKPFHHEGLTEDQITGLGQPQHNLTPTERWFAMWDILYPNTERPDSPFVGSTIQEHLSIARRVLQAAPGIFSNLIAEGNPSRIFDWNYLSSHISGMQDRLFQLTSDRPGPGTSGVDHLDDTGSFGPGSVDHWDHQRNSQFHDYPLIARQSFSGNSNDQASDAPVPASTFPDAAAPSDETQFIDPQLLNGEGDSYPTYSEGPQSPLSSLLRLDPSTSHSTAPTSLLPDSEELGTSGSGPAGGRP
jgi:hypothetical protein